jgi:predicted nicotinamide N-methyase
VSAEVLQHIRLRLPLQPVPTVPEIVLHKAIPSSGLRLLAEWDDAFNTPYWAHYWGGGLALARYVLDHPDAVAGRSVLDLGAGSGIVAIAAAKAGAAQVRAADVDGYAVAAAMLNAAANRVAIIPQHDDLTAQAPPPVDVVLVGDLFYEQNLARRVMAFLDRCLAAKITVLIGDPGRARLPRRRLRLLAEYAGPDFGGIEGRNAVFSYLSGRASRRPSP